jgi:hypothetical protein
MCSRVVKVYKTAVMHNYVFSQEEGGVKKTERNRGNECN